ncbi:MAG TPA: SRPBCC family protein [Methylomirabilota bacterium]|nr:SRPBCC family protein [Methylomirabilota bacterium]
MLWKILIALVVIVVGLVTVIALQPARYRVSRSTTIAAPAPVVFGQVNDFHRWTAWSPWEKIDPAMKRTYEGPPAGVGASYTWVGSGEVGEGRMTIVESRPSDLIQVKLEFVKPFAGTSVAEFSFKPEGDRTLVTWSMTGDKNFIAKAIHLVMSMDRMIGDQFDKGLAAMKTVAEAAPRP